MSDALVPNPVVNVVDAVSQLTKVLGTRRIVVLTGAGASTESGIPDYRGPETSRRARNPMTFDQFVASPASRARYWARATVGWERIRAASSNAVHHSLARLEGSTRFVGLITQNVDRLHHQAGSKQVVELHGSLHEVRCLSCDTIESRASLQQRHLRLNPGWQRREASLAPDGDADLDATAAEQFRVVGCLSCGGPLKPDVVFFGENVPRPRVERAYGWVDRAEALIVVGSSLTVFSGYRFAKRAHKQGKPIVIINVGPTRADPIATVKIEGRAGAVLPALVDGLSKVA